MNLMIRGLGRNLSSALLVALAATAAPSAFAQNGSPPGTVSPNPAMQRTEPPVNDARTPPPPGEAVGPAKFSELDANGDQKISRDEAAMDARLAANFSVHDLDGDGAISLSEYQAGQNKRVGDK
ncbi:hypothetical protein [Pseudomonas sp. CGJS7]|uniref:hypothetical protein n=1 Tax=Pseudomonas sp. CGJS7 TaxID=3109348 RepID=UPI0030099D6B